MTHITEVTAPFFEAGGTMEEESPIIDAWIKILIGLLALAV
jgi:hypothetical protein